MENTEEKVKNLKIKNQNDLLEINNKIKREMESSEFLRNEISKKENECKKFEENLFESNQKNQLLQDENNKMVKKIESYENILSYESLKLLQTLIKEINDCSSDLDSLIGICLDIYNRAAAATVGPIVLNPVYTIGP